MPKQDKTSEIISLIFLTRRFFHEQMADGSRKTFSFLQYKTLQHIKEKKPLMKEIADFWGITPPSATSLMDKLIESEMIKRVPDNKDRRIVRIVITKKGEKHLKKGEAEITRKLKEKLKLLSCSEQENLVEILSKLLGNMKANS